LLGVERLRPRASRPKPTPAKMKALVRRTPLRPRRFPFATTRRTSMGTTWSRTRPRLPTRRSRSLTRSNSLIKELSVAVLLFHGSEGGFVGYMDSVRGSSPPSLHPSNEPEPQTIIPAMMCPLAAHRLKRIAISSKRLIPFFPTHDANDQLLAYVYGRETKADADIAHVLTMDEARCIAIGRYGAYRYRLRVLSR